MKKSIILLYSLVFCCFVSVFAQQKEVVLIGTMHGVPKMLKNAYRPMLKKAKAYQPEAIYVEIAPAWDTLSLQIYFPKFCAKSDSLRQVLKLDAAAVVAVQQKALSEMSPQDFKLMWQYHTLNLDYANAKYYAYLVNYGLEGAAKSLRNENTELTAKLGIAMGLTNIHSMDNQWDNKAYGQSWYKCSQADKTDKDKGYKKLFRKMIGLTLNQGLHAITGNLGAFSNRKKTTELYHRGNSFRYRETPCEACEDGTKYWDLRNQRMAQNIGNQILENDMQRNVVVVGAGHIVGLQEVLAAEYPDIKVRLYREF